MTTDTSQIPAVERAAAAIDAFFDAWNAAEDAAVAAAVAAAYHDDAVLKDPLASISGHEAIAGFIATVHAQYPGYRFRRSTEVDGHNDVIRFGWHLVSPAGEVTADGREVALVGDDGRLAYSVGFFSPPTPLESLG